MTVRATFTPNPKLKRLLKRSMDNAAEAMAKEVSREALRRVPVDTGRLKRSHFRRKSGGQHRWIVGFSAFYGTYVHRRNPWLRNAVHAVRSRARTAAARAMKATLS